MTMAPPISVVFPFLGHRIGGSHISAIRLAVELEQRGSYECTFICPRNTPLQEELWHQRLRVVDSGEPPKDRWPIGSDLAHLLRRRALLSGISKGRKTVVHCNDVHALGSWFMPARSLSLPVLYHHRSLNEMTWKKRLVLSHVAHTICISTSTYKNVSFLSRSKCSQIWNPFSTKTDTTSAAQCRRALRNELALKDDTCVVGFVGNFWKRKRPLYFIDVARHMLSRNSRFHFVLFGESGDMSQTVVRNYISQHRLESFFSLLGFRLPPEANISALDLLLAPAVGEPFGRTLIEAIVVGVPFVATDDAGHREIVDRWGGGTLVPNSAPSNTFALAALSSLKQPRNSALQAEARSRVANELSIERHIRHVDSVYRRVLYLPKMVFADSEDARQIVTVRGWSGSGATVSSGSSMRPGRPDTYGNQTLTRAVRPDFSQGVAVSRARQS
jgi:glycosyltransferase involved in cell wall biosynthesis